MVLDEAYYEFAAHDPNYPSCLDYLDSGKSIIGLRTFSKAYGLAGIRTGYGFAPQSIVDAVNRAREPFNVNSLAQVAAVAALDDDAHIQKTVQNNRAGMKLLTGALEKHGAKVYQSHANFLFADFQRSTRPIFQELMQRGVIVRPGDIFGTPTFLRVSIGTPEENAKFIEALEGAIANLPPSVSA